MSSWTAIRQHLESLRAKLVHAEHEAQARIATVGPDARPSTRNLIHYLTLRREDVRRLQLELGQLGLSSLGRSEGYVLSNLEAVLARVCEAEQVGAPAAPAGSELSWSEAETLLHANTRAIFGPKPTARHVYIMVTAPDANTADLAWFERQLTAGMNVLRINTAHGSAREWRLIAERARAAAARLACNLRILVDLPGPKIRTLAIQDGPRVRKLKPERDAYGRVIAPCRVRLGAQADAAGAPDYLQVPEAALSVMRPSDTLEFFDTRDRPRSLRVVEVGESVIGELDRTAYVAADTRMTLRDAEGDERTNFTCSTIPAAAYVAAVPIGGRLVLARDKSNATRVAGDVPVFLCSHPEIFDAVRVGCRVMIDDGKIETTVVDGERDRLVLEVVRAKRGTAKIRGDMGLNLPGADLVLPSVSDHDAEAIAFLHASADLVGLSFVRSIADVKLLEERLTRQELGLMLKVESRAGFEALPAILLECLGRRPLAVMIARGDLAVEVGFERLAEVQEEILWLCEASHVPVVWATEVLDTLAKTGFPTRAEVTDAAMSVRAECVMLNKGAFIESATQALDSILQRMEAHVYKKRQLYRPLHLTLGF